MPVTREYGGPSMVAPLRRVLLKQPDEGVAEAARWREFGYHHPPDVAAARREHAAFADVLRQAGVEVALAEERQPERLDSIFATDPAIVTEAGAIIGSPGKELRRGEEAALARELTGLGVPILGALSGDATLEGGDVLRLDADTLVIARSYRTNDAGYAQVRALLDGRIRDVLQVHLPHWRGRGEILHLLSLISPVADDVALVYAPLLPVPLMELLEARGIERIEVPDEEFTSHGCNALAIAPRRVIMVRGNPITAQRLRARGVDVWDYAGDEITHNRDGGPTCLTCCIHRSR
ncbi:MAG TPA: arginine deiminase family protein [Ktedonobacterales bacterium]